MSETLQNELIRWRWTWKGRGHGSYQGSRHKEAEEDPGARVSDGRTGDQGCSRFPKVPLMAAVAVAVAGGAGKEEMRGEKREEESGVGRTLWPPPICQGSPAPPPLLGAVQKRGSELGVGPAMLPVGMGFAAPPPHCRCPLLGRLARGSWPALTSVWLLVTPELPTPPSPSQRLSFKSPGVLPTQSLAAPVHNPQPPLSCWATLFPLKPLIQTLVLHLSLPLP